MAITHDKQFTLYSHPQGANPWKVALILEELGLSYHTISFTDWADIKKPEYTAVCPTGTVPVLIDHFNAGFKIWDSGAIVLYLIEKYDTSNKISFANLEEGALAKQYLMFQMSSQGPSYREVLWYTVYCPEDVPTVISRHIADIRGILTVLSTTLETSENGFLVGGRPSYADLCFLPWNWCLEIIPGMSDWKEEYPVITRWEERILGELKSVRKVKEAREEALKALQ